MYKEHGGYIKFLEGPTFDWEGLRAKLTEATTQLSESLDMEDFYSELKHHDKMFVHLNYLEKKNQIRFWNSTPTRLNKRMRQIELQKVRAKLMFLHLATTAVQESFWLPRGVKK